MNAYDRVYTLLIESQQDWSQHVDTGEFQKIPQKIKTKKLTNKKRGKRPKERRINDIAIIRGKIAKAATADATIRAKGKRGADLY